MFTGNLSVNLRLLAALGPTFLTVKLWLKLVPILTVVTDVLPVIPKSAVVVGVGEV